jgi:DNA-binding MarR family transcriptional regulator
MQPETLVTPVFEAIAHVQRLTDAFQQRRQQLARQVGLTEQQWRVLEEISTEHFIPSMFARTRDSSRPAVSKILRQLIDKRLVTVSVAPGDARHRRYVLTPSGKRTMERLRRSRQQAIDVVWSDLDPHALSHFNAFSHMLVQRLENYAHDIAGEEQ